MYRRPCWLNWRCSPICWEGNTIDHKSISSVVSLARRWTVFFSSSLLCHSQEILLPFYGMLVRHVRGGFSFIADQYGGTAIPTHGKFLHRCPACETTIKNGRKYIHCLHTRVVNLSFTFYNCFSKQYFVQDPSGHIIYLNVGPFSNQRFTSFRSMDVRPITISGGIRPVKE